MYQDSLYSRLKSGIVKSKNILVPKSGTDGAGKSSSGSDLTIHSKVGPAFYKRPIAVPELQGDAASPNLQKLRIVDPFHENALVLIVALASYPLFSLDEIGAELQNPFSSQSKSSPFRWNLQEHSRQCDGFDENIG